MGKPFDARPATPAQPDRPLAGDPRQPIERRGPYEILTDYEIHNRFSMDVRSTRLRMPNDEVREVLPTRFPHQATLMGLTVNGSIVCSLEPVHGTNERNIETSGGVKGEGSIEEAAMRKVQEEIHVTTDAATVRPLISIRTDSPFLWNLTHQSIADVRTMEDVPEDQRIKRILIPAESARSKVLSGEINTANIAVHALLMADYLEGKGMALPHVETRIMPGGKWIDKKPAPWKLETLAANADGTPLTTPTADGGTKTLTRGESPILERTVMHETESGDAQLIHDRIQKPDGTSGDQYFLTYPRHMQVVAVDELGNAYLKKEHSFAYDEEIYTLPLAAIGDEETNGQAAQRIAARELGVDVAPTSMWDLNEWGETTSRMDYKVRIVAVPVRAEDMAGRDDMVAINVDEGWETIKSNIVHDPKETAESKAQREEQTKIAGIKVDTLTPVLALGLLKHTRLQPAA